MEAKYVRGVYEQMAGLMADPRYRAWPKVRQFILAQPRHSLIADIGPSRSLHRPRALLIWAECEGCGAGKYFTVGTDRVMFVGVDVCSALLGVAKAKGKRCDVAAADTLALPFADGSFDAVISVSVIHHLTTESRRRQAVQELARILKPGQDRRLRLLLLGIKADVGQAGS